MPPAEPESTKRVGVPSVDVPTEKSPKKVEEAETITPMVEVGLMAFAPINCQLDPPSLADQ